MTRPFEPMLASPAVLDKLSFPLLGSPKLDGIRAVVRGGKVLSRKLIAIPSGFVQTCFGKLEHLDGELIIGPATAPDVMQTSMGVTRKGYGQLDVRFHVFDHIERPSDPFMKRWTSLQLQVGLTGLAGRVEIVQQSMLHDLEGVLKFEQSMVDLGYEGIMLRNPGGMYKFGRSTAREGLLLKVKRFEDAEARIIGCEAELENTNVAMTSNTGRTKRSTAAAGLVPKDKLGAFVVRGINGPFEGVEFSVGGFTEAQKQELWASRDDLGGKVIKYKFFKHGSKDAPRHPGFLGFRDSIDL